MLIDPYILILGSVYTDELGNMNSSSNPGVAGASFTFEFKCYGFEENIAMEDLQFETTKVEENKYYN